MNIGQKLYKYSSVHLLEYTVTGILTREEGLYYQVLCNSCNHSKNCEILIHRNDEGCLVYVSMITDLDEDEKHHYAWHETMDKDYFYATKKEALDRVFRRNIRALEEELKNLQTRVTNRKESIERYEGYLKGLTEKEERSFTGSIGV